MLLSYFLYYISYRNLVYPYHLHNHQVEVTKQTRHFNQMQPLIAHEPNDAETGAGANDHILIS